MNFETWSDRSVIADCLRSLGLHDYAKKVFLPKANQELVDKYLSIIVSEAKRKKDRDVLEPLYINGLVKG